METGWDQEKAAAIHYEWVVFTIGLVRLTIIDTDTAVLKAEHAGGCGNGASLKRKPCSGVR